MAREHPWDSWHGHGDLLISHRQAEGSEFLKESTNYPRSVEDFKKNECPLLSKIKLRIFRLLKIKAFCSSKHVVYRPISPPKVVHYKSKLCREPLQEWQEWGNTGAAVALQEFWCAMTPGSFLVWHGDIPNMTGEG